MKRQTTLSSMVERCPLLPGYTLCEQLTNADFERGNGTSLLILGADGKIGVLDRDTFLQLMAGGFGYGRSLWGRRPISSVARWGLPAVTFETTVRDAAALMVDTTDGYRDLPVVDASGAAVGVVRPARVMRALADDAAHQAETDALTGLASRARFIDDLTARLSAIGGGMGAVVVAFVDLDGLKGVNDSQGHAAGDELLRHAAWRLRWAIRPEDTVGRLGGDEFAVAATIAHGPVAYLEEASVQLGERLRAALSTANPSQPDAPRTWASVGVAFSTETGGSSGALLGRADEAMYAAKRAGGDQVRLAVDSRVSGREMNAAGLHLAYQPILAPDGSVPSVEALLRHQQPGSEASFPLDVLRRAVRQSATLDLDRWVLREACRAWSRWRHSWTVAPKQIHVNLAPDSLRSPRLADSLIAVTDEEGMDPSHVVLELSELAGVDDLLRARGELEALARAGFRLALDDMGATLATLRLVGTELVIDCVKVDRSVIAGAAQGVAVDIEIIALLGRLAEAFGLVVVAEGIETEEERASLAHLPHAHEQGFLHARALDEAALHAYLHGADAAADESEPEPEASVEGSEQDSSLVP